MDRIRTPDRRLRVFVSSTLGELAAERRAAARAVAALRLTSVMFETGARPQPPGEVYRAYLAQSDVFLGIYWQRYGQLVPGLEVSGLEEEYELSRGMPRLLYVKTPAPERDPRLAQLLGRIAHEAAYRSFRTPTELGRLVHDDLAQLLSERFATAATAPAPAAPSTGLVDRSVMTPAPLPASTTSLVGRRPDVDDVTGLLTRSGRRWVTLTGPGGLGKTRLALALADGAHERAGLLTGAIDGLRRRAGLRVYASLRRDGDLADAVRVATGSERFDELFAAGSRLAMADLLARARDGLRAPSKAGSPS